MLVALNGRLRCGKDTAANRIEQIVAVTNGHLPVYRRAFADPLKNSAAALLDITRDELEAMKLDPDPSILVYVGTGSVQKPKKLTGRQYLERYGTEAHRDIFGQSFWLDQALPESFDHSDGLYLITDCRFPNEAQRVRDLDGIVVEIVGPEGREGNGHPSDTPLPDELIDFTVDNTVRDDEFEHLDQQLIYALAMADLVAS